MHAWWERFRKGLRKEKGGVASYNLQLGTVQAADAKGLVAMPRVTKMDGNEKKRPTVGFLHRLLEPSMADGASTASTMGMAPNAAMADA